MRQPTHRLDILRKHFEAARNDRLDIGQHALEVRRQRFDCGARIQRLISRTQAAKCAAPPSGKIVTIHRGQHDVFESHQLHGACAVGGSSASSQPCGIARVDRAEATGARAHRAHQHQRRGPGIPTLADVRALGFFAYGREPVLFDDGADGIEAVTRRHRRAQPLRLAAQHDERLGAADALMPSLIAVKPCGGAVLVAAATAVLPVGTMGMPLNSLTSIGALRAGL